MLPKEHWLIRTSTTIVVCCIILFDFHKCRPTCLENVFRLVPSAWGQSGEHALRPSSHSAAAWRLLWSEYLSIAPYWQGGCTCFIPFSVEILVINQPWYICKGNLQHREILLIPNYTGFSSCVQQPLRQRICLVSCTFPELFIIIHYVWPMHCSGCVMYRNSIWKSPHFFILLFSLPELRPKEKNYVA